MKRKTFSLPKLLFFALLTCGSLHSVAQVADVFAGEWIVNGYIDGKQKYFGSATTELVQNGKYIRFSFSFTDSESKKTSQEQYLADYSFSDEGKNYAVFDYALVEEKKKTKGAMYFVATYENRLKLLHGTFYADKKDVKHPAIVWTLHSKKQLDILRYKPTSRLIEGAKVFTDSVSKLHRFMDGVTVMDTEFGQTLLTGQGDTIAGIWPGKYAYDIFEYDGRNHMGELPFNNSGFYHGISIVRDPNTGKYGFIDTTGKIIVSCILNSAKRFQEDGFGWGQILDEEKNVYHSFYFDRSGKRYADHGFAKGNSLYRYAKRNVNDQTTYVYYKTGELAFTTKFQITEKGNGLYSVEQGLPNGGQKYGFIDTTGKLAIPFVFDDLPQPFHEGLALVSTNLHQPTHEQIFIDAQGRSRIRFTKSSPIQPNNPGPFQYGYSQCYVDINGTREYALIDTLGKIHVIKERIQEQNPHFFKDISRGFNLEILTRNEMGIYIRLSTCFKIGSPTAYIMDHGRLVKTMGIGGGQPDCWEAKGIGLVNYEGRFLILPQLTSLDYFDQKSELAKATLYDREKNQTAEGYVFPNGTFFILRFLK